jgi:hypothetical protein
MKIFTITIAALYVLTVLSCILQLYVGARQRTNGEVIFTLISSIAMLVWSAVLLAGTA